MADRKQFYLLKVKTLWNLETITNDHHEHPVETINQKCDPDPQNPDIQNDDTSWTKIKTKHICSGYTYTVVSPHCTNRVRTHRGEEAGKHFLESLMEEEIRISVWLKEIEMKEQGNGKQKQNVTFAMISSTKGANHLYPKINI